MIYSYSQINQYLSCPRSYRHRYIEGWKEKDTRANLVFGRAFEAALGAYFRREDPGQRLHDEWAQFRGSELDYGRGDTWDSMLTQGIQLLERFCQDNRVQVADPQSQLQLRIHRQLSSSTEFVSYIDAVGSIDGIRSIIEWKTTSLVCAYANRNWFLPLFCERPDVNLIGLTSLIVKDPPLLPKLDPQRARFVIEKIDDILHWENAIENTRDSKFVELGKYLCEVRAGQYWRTENLKSFDDFLNGASRNRGAMLITLCLSTSICRSRLRKNYQASVGQRPLNW